MTTRKRTITINEEVSETDPPRVEIRVSLGKVTIANVLAAARKLEKAAAGANAPTEAEVYLDSFGDGGIEARIRWQMP